MSQVVPSMTRGFHMDIRSTAGNPEAVVPDITVTGLTAPVGYIFANGTRLRTYEFRDTISFDRGRHLIRAGFEFRRIFEGLSLGPASAGSFGFNSLLDFAHDRVFRQTITVNPATGEPVGFPRYFHLHDSGAFIQDEWRIKPGINLSLGIRHDYFGTATEREGRLSSIVFWAGRNIP